MSILDSVTDEKGLKLQQETMIRTMELLKADSTLSPKMQSILELMGEGLSLGDIIGIEKKHRDALLVQAIGFFEAGDMQSAKDVLTRLVLFEPLDERPIYLLGVIAQQQGAFEAAAQLYVQVIGLAATYPDGHLRLGECLLAAGELEKAEAFFRQGLSLAAKAGQADRVTHAELMIATIKARQAN